MAELGKQLRADFARLFGGKGPKGVGVQLGDLGHVQQTQLGHRTGHPLGALGATLALARRLGSRRRVLTGAANQDAEQKEAPQRRELGNLAGGQGSREKESGGAVGVCADAGQIRSTGAGTGTGACAGTRAYLTVGRSRMFEQRRKNLMCPPGIEQRRLRVLAHSADAGLRFQHGQ